MATSVPPSSAVKDAALGRLARSDAVGLIDHGSASDYAAIEEAAVRRLVSLKHATATGADLLFGAVIELLQTARLTISFKCPAWFYHENTSREYTTFFVTGRSGAAADMERRDGAEQTMFGYVPAPEVPPAAAVNETARARDLRLARLRSQQLGATASPHFQGAMRPRYAAVDFAHCASGGTTKYGRSYFVLREHMKHAATFCHRDSFEVAQDLRNRRDEDYGGRVYTLEEAMASFHQLGKIVYLCDRHQLGVLCDYARRTRERGGEPHVLGGLTYIEAQLHSDVRFDRDVEMLCISTVERTNERTIHPMHGAMLWKKKTAWDERDHARVEKHARRFASANGLLYKSVV